MAASEAHRAIDAIWRIEATKVIAALARATRDVGFAEELAQDALVAALEQWPTSGIPSSPGAWLTTVAKRRAIDRVRRDVRRERKHEEVARDLAIEDESADASFDAILDPHVIDDDILRLIFVACHPVLSIDAHVALTLRLIGGLTTDEIARAFLIAEATVAQRIVRAKRTLREARVAFEVPPPEERSARVGSVLRVIYLIFNEGYSATAGDAWMRPQLCEDAMRLGRILANLLANESEVQGLVALMELQASRLRARTGRDGEAILLLDQDRGRWDHLLIARGLAALDRAAQLASSLGPYALQAAIAACHARARTPEATDWERIVALYDGLAELVPSPVIELNRAVAISMAYGPAAALEIVDALRAESALANYHLLSSVRGDLLAKLRRFDESRIEFERAAMITRNARERDVLLARAAACERDARAALS